MAFAPMTGEWDYVLRRERKLPEEEQTVWTLGSLTFRDMEYVLRRAVKVDDDGNVKVDDASNAMVQARRVLNRGLRGWKNFRRHDGSQVEFRSVNENGVRILPEDILDMIHPDAIELANAITERAHLTEKLEKNSGSP